MVNGGHGPPSDFRRLGVLVEDFRSIEVLRAQFHTTSPQVQPLAGEVPVDSSQHDLPMCRLGCLAHQNDRFVEDAGVSHRVATSAEDKGRLRVFEQLPHQVNAVDLMVFGRVGKACRDGGAGGLYSQGFGRQGTLGRQATSMSLTFNFSDVFLFEWVTTDLGWLRTDSAKSKYYPLFGPKLGNYDAT